MSRKRAFSRDKILCDSKTSSFRTHFRDKPHPQQQNVLIRTAKPGQNTPSAAKYPHLGRKTGTNTPAAAKYPHLGRKTGTTTPAAAKHPHSDRKTWTKYNAATKYPCFGRKTGKKKGDPPQSRPPFSYWNRNCNPLQCSLNLNNLVSLNNVSNFNVVVAVDVQTAIVAAVNLLNIVLEAFQ